MKKGIAVLLTFCMLVCVSCTGAGNPGQETNPALSTQASSETVIDTQPDTLPDTQPTEENDEQIQKTLSDWYNYLFINDRIYGDVLWSISYMEAFIRKPTWENLTIARAALATAEKYVNARDTVETSMTAADYVEMMEKGYDVASVKVDIEKYGETRLTMLTDIATLKNMIYNEVFWKDTFKCFAEYVKNLKAIYEKELEYLNVETEYLLLAINSRTWSDKFHTFVTDNCRWLPVYQPGTVSDMNDAVEKASAILDVIEALIEEEIYQVGQERAALYQIEDAIRNEDYSTLLNSFIEIEGLQNALPFPDWNLAENVDYYYFYRTENNEQYYPVEQEELTAKPDGWLIRFGDADREKLIGYQQQLSSLGLDPYDISDKNGKYTLTYVLGDSLYMFTQTEGHTDFFTSRGDMEFVPLLYLYT